jgi:membrane-bound lytic murein transglycosylase D
MNEKRKPMYSMNSKYSNYSKIITISCLMLASLFLFQGKAVGEDAFVIPPNLQDNVEFWKQIYTEISLKEGVIHDRDYPIIIYRRIGIGGKTGSARRNYIKENINAVEQLLKNMAQKSPEQWTGMEQQVADLFKQYANIDEIKDAASRVRFQLGQKERFKDGLERAAAYMPFILSIFEQYKIPTRIAYLPHVESSFNTDARSRVGAAGMWQFMRGTGRIFHLKIDTKIDERCDPVKATIAAAKLLAGNYERLQSWPLAITAYNHGPESIVRAVQETGSRDLGVIIDQYQNRRFKFASKNFYGCFIAASEIALNPEKYFSDIMYHPPLKYNEIRLKSSARPKTLAKNLGISEQKLKELNPALRPIIFNRQLPIPAGYNLRIPGSISPTIEGKN